jgi:cytochrome c-type biogenesis protein CcmH/NrfF
MNWRNAWLWAAPAVLMLIGLIIAANVMLDRQRRLKLEPPGADVIDEEDAGRRPGSLDT